MTAEEYKKKKTIVNIVVIAFVIILFVAFYFIFDKWMKDGEEKQFQEAVNTMKLNYLMNSGKMHYSFETSGHTVRIKMWVDGFGAASKLAAQGDSDAFDGWVETKKSMYELSKEIYKVFILVDDAVVYLNIVNDLNTDRDLLVFRNRELVYDVVAAYQNGG